MKKLADLQARQGEIDARQKTILAEATTATGGELTEAQRTEFDGLDTEYAKNEGDIATLVKDAERAARLNSRVPTKVTLPTQTGRTDAGTAPVIVKPDGFMEDPKRGFKDHAEFLTLVQRAGERGGYTEDNRLRSLTPPENPGRYGAAGSDEQSGASDAYGGYLMPVGFTPVLLSRSTEDDPTAGRTTKIPMTTASLPINARVDSNHSTSVSGGFVVYRREETQAVTGSRMAFEQVVLNAHSLMGLAYTTEECLARSPISFMALIEAGFRSEFPAKILREKLNGATGGYGGVIGASGTINQAARAGQGAATILFENLVDMRSRCWRYGGAIWLYNHDTLPQLMTCIQQVGTAGVPAWQPSMREDRPDMILGRPAFPSEFCKTLGTSGDIILGVWSEYLEATLQGIQSAESMHVRFENHERAFKFWTENDGRPWWRAPLTPAVSAVTLAPFVTLATR